MPGQVQPTITKNRLVEDFRRLGLAPGQTVMMHAALRQVGWVVGGPDVVLDALMEVLGPAGTLMMYVSWEEWERALVMLDDLDPDRRQAYIETCPPFDPRTSRAMRGWSVLTEYLRTRPGAFRSSHPTASVAAVGEQAQWLTADHPLEYGYGLGSPFDKLCQVSGKLLLLGSPLATITLFHYAEHIARIPNKRVVQNQLPLLVDGRRQWVTFEEFDTTTGIRAGASSDDYFDAIIRAYQAHGNGCTSKVGAADSYLFDAPDLAGFAVRWLEDRFKE